jgi:hypothetical protein
MSKRTTPTQKKQVHDDLRSGYRGSAIAYYNYCIEEHRINPEKVIVSPSSFKRIVHELRQEYGQHYVMDEKQPTVSPYGTPFSIYFLNPEIRSQQRSELPEYRPAANPGPALVDRARSPQPTGTRSQQQILNLGGAYA